VYQKKKKIYHCGEHPIMLEIFVYIKPHINTNTNTATPPVGLWNICRTFVNPPRPGTRRCVRLYFFCWRPVYILYVYTNVNMYIYIYMYIYILPVCETLLLLPVPCIYWCRNMNILQYKYLKINTSCRFVGLYFFYRRLVHTYICIYINKTIHIYM